MANISKSMEIFLESKNFKFINSLAGKLSIQEAISLIDKEQLNELKSQCGGLQTLLKNHGHIFEGSFNSGYVESLTLCF